MNVGIGAGPRSGVAASDVRDGYGPGRTAVRPGAMLRALHTEWTKLRTLPGTWWLVVAIVVLTAAVGALTTGAIDTDQCRTHESCGEDVVKLSLTGTWVGQTAVAVLAVLAVSGEYATGTIRTTLTAMPRRGRVLAAKAAVLAAVTAAAGTAAVLASVAAGRYLLLDGGFTRAHGYRPLSLADGPTARAAFGTVLYLVLIALLSAGVTWLLRDTAGALTAVLALLYVFPVLASLVSDDKWMERLNEIGPASAGMAVQTTVDVASAPIGPWAGLGVLTLWAAGWLALGATALLRRDA
ncbi:ABC transporter permease subunit [Yinghuangia sp. YIM S09857]|uniref:ABC transporter permease subunit n=1 Tax=Yinghuangia sp. YIM S09857 TaxID=3436929 RepID=UPI003F5395FA